ncbi:MAG: hypothetical protein AAF633_02080 [Chloroflexota bacterium]
MINLQHLNLRSPDLVMQPERLGVMWGNRMSFVHRMLSLIFKEGWRISVEKNRLDPNGCGELIYHIQTNEQPLKYVVFSTKLDEEERQDRVIADRWDAATALIVGDLTEERLATLRAGVPKQEYGRAEPGTLVWSRGNRSSRFFDHVVQALATGQQPDVNYLAQGGYLLRSTAYYANAKFGLSSYLALQSAQTHPLKGSYMAQMFSAFLFREFSLDLAEHIAACQAPRRAVRLDPQIRRFIGIGNATGMGLVPYVINNPHVIHSWIYAREVTLARIGETPIEPSSPQLKQLFERLKHVRQYFEEDLTLRQGLFALPTELIPEIDLLLGALREMQSDFRVERQTIEPLEVSWSSLIRWAEARCRLETVELLSSLLIDLYPSYAADAVPLLDEAILGSYQPEMRLDELRVILNDKYRWALDMDLDLPDARKFFWYYSADSEEPLIGERGKDSGEDVERPLNIPFRIQALRQALDDIEPEASVAEFLLVHPEHRFIVERIQRSHHLNYAEVRTNLMDANVIPLYTQRFQLAQYGMERFNPQSIYWVRVTLLQGAPTVKELNTGTPLDWEGFSLRPTC